MDAGKVMGSSLGAIVKDVSLLHSPFFKSSLPDFLSDMLINSLSHIRWEKTDNLLAVITNNYYDVTGEKSEALIGIKSTTF